MLSSDFIGQLPDLIAFYVDSLKEAERPLKDIYNSLSLLHFTQIRRESRKWLRQVLCAKFPLKISNRCPLSFFFPVVTAIISIILHTVSELKRQSSPLFLIIRCSLKLSYWRIEIHNFSITISPHFLTPGAQCYGSVRLFSAQTTRYLTTSKWSGYKQPHVSSVRFSCYAVLIQLG